MDCLLKHIFLEVVPPNIESGHQETKHSGTQVKFDSGIDPDCGQRWTLQGYRQHNSGENEFEYLAHVD